MTFQWPCTKENIHKGEISPILVLCMYCVPQHFVSVLYSFSSHGKTTTTSNAYPLCIYSLFFSDPQQTCCAENRHDATRRDFDNSQIHRPNCASRTTPTRIQFHNSRHTERSSVQILVMFIGKIQW